jgi:hypothetical protein
MGDSVNHLHRAREATQGSDKLDHAIARVLGLASVGIDVIELGPSIRMASRVVRHSPRRVWSTLR